MNNQEYDVSRHEELSEMFLGTIKTNMKVMYGQHEYDPNLVSMQNWYLRLFEVYRHDKNRQSEIIEDWLRYLHNTSRLMSGNYLWMEREHATKEEDEEHFAEQKKLGWEAHEIENRFAKLVGAEEELEILRLKDQIHRKLFLVGNDEFKIFLQSMYGTTDVKNVSDLKRLLEVLTKMEDSSEVIAFTEKNQSLVTILKEKLKAST